MVEVFDYFSFCCHFVSYSFRFRYLRFASMRNKRKKAFFASKRKKNFRFCFASFRFEAKMTAHPNSELGKQNSRCFLLILDLFRLSTVSCLP
jgi:hypothetical protein